MSRQFSTLTKMIMLSPNHSGKRKNEITRFIPHCVVGQASAKRIGEIFQPTSRQASCNYGIGYDGTIIGIVSEQNRSWCTSSAIVDNKGITVEVASDSTKPWAFTDAAWKALIELAVDICKYYGKKKLLWFPDKATRKSYVAKSDEMVIEVHRDYANKACPGDWCYDRLPDFAKIVTARLAKEPTPTPQPQPTPKPDIDPAQSKDNSLRGTWQVTAKSGLYIRAGAGTNKKALGCIPYGDKVTCYGYYTKNWLYVVWKGITGFCYKGYLKKL